MVVGAEAQQHMQRGNDGLISSLVMWRPFIRWLALVGLFSERLDVSCERFTKRFQPFQFLLLLIDRFVQLLDQVFLKGEFCFDVY